MRPLLGVTAEGRRFDTVLMGWRTHQPAVDTGLAGGAYPHLRQVVATHRSLPEDYGIETIRGDLVAQVRALKQEDGRDIWLCGGGDLAAQLVEVIDEIQLKVNPILMGHGISLLPAAGGPRSWELASCEQLLGGVVLLTYRAPQEMPTQ